MVKETKDREKLLIINYFVQRHALEGWFVFCKVIFYQLAQIWRQTVPASYILHVQPWAFRTAFRSGVEDYEVQQGRENLLAGQVQSV